MVSGHQTKLIVIVLLRILNKREKLIVTIAFLICTERDEVEKLILILVLLILVEISPF